MTAILTQYVEGVRGLKDPRPIVVTLRGDFYGDVLCYKKGALIWEMLRGKLGNQKMLSVLRGYYTAHKNGPPATSQNLIETFERETSGETNRIFEEFFKTTSLSNPNVRFRGEK